MKRILIGSPVHQKTAILQEFLNSLVNLDHEGLDLHYYFVDDNEEASSSAELESFRNKHPNVRIEKNTEAEVYNEASHHWRTDVIEKVGKNKDKILHFARKNGFDFVFLADSDLVLHPKTLTHLVSLEKEVVSEVFWTAWTENTMEMPQVWLYDEYGFTSDKKLTEEVKSQKFFEFVTILKQKGVYPVGGLGACTMISKSALEKGVLFERIYNLTFWGEDRHFCIRAAALNIQLFASTFYSPLHLYRDSDLERVQAFWQAIKSGDANENEKN